MFRIIFNIIFFIISIIILVKSIFYAIYEINNENNKSGGICVIIFSSLVVLFANIMVLTR